MISFSKILVIVAHPDDEILGCGGFLSKFADEPFTEVRIIAMNDGRSEQVPIEFNKACEKIGVDSRMMYGFKTSKFDKYKLVDFTKIIEAEIEAYSPDTILTHFEGDLHQDHRMVNHAVQIASRTKKSSPVNCLMTFPVISSSNFNTVSFAANFYVDITNHIETKLEALRCYKSELNHDLGRTTEAVEASAKFYGYNVGYKYAEVFQIQRIRQ